MQPPIVHTLLEEFGWRATCVVLGGLAVLIGAPLALRFIREHPTSRTDTRLVDGATVRDGLSSRAFWTVTVVFFCSTFLRTAPSFICRRCSPIAECLQPVPQWRCRHSVQRA